MSAEGYRISNQNTDETVHFVTFYDGIPSEKTAENHVIFLSL
jgi:hypothetical protein